jgi:hypothetical protein
VRLLESDSDELKSAISDQERANEEFERLSVGDKFNFLKIDRLQVPLIMMTGIVVGLIFSFMPGRRQISELFISSAFAADGNFMTTERGMVVIGVFICLLICLAGVFFSPSARVSKVFESLAQTLVGGLLGLIVPH